MNHPWLKFYVRDWIGDMQLRQCSIASRGVWFELLCVMHCAKRPGYLESASGKALSEDSISTLIGVPKGDLVACMAELLSHEVPSVTEDGTWFNRRMVRDNAKALKCSEAGSKGGGNPALREEADKKKPDTRSHISLKDTFKGDDSGDPVSDGYTDDFLAFWKAYPKKKSKGAAFTAWKKAKTKPELDKLLAIVARHAASAQWQKSGGEFIPHPASWLNSKAWDDELSTEEEPYEGLT